MSQIILKHLDALAAQMQLALAQIDAMRHAMKAEEPPAVPSIAIDLPPRCAGVEGMACALRDGEWNTGKRTLGNPGLVFCDGCGHQRNAATGF